MCVRARDPRCDMHVRHIRSRSNGNRIRANAIAVVFVLLFLCLFFFFCLGRVCMRNECVCVRARHIRGKCFETHTHSYYMIFVHAEGRQASRHTKPRPGKQLHDQHISTGLYWYGWPGHHTYTKTHKMLYSLRVCARRKYNIYDEISRKK